MCLTSVFDVVCAVFILTYVVVCSKLNFEQFNFCAESKRAWFVTLIPLIARKLKPKIKCRCTQAPKRSVYVVRHKPKSTGGGKFQYMERIQNNYNILSHSSLSLSLLSFPHTWLLPWPSIYRQMGGGVNPTSSQQWLQGGCNLQRISVPPQPRFG